MITALAISVTAGCGDSLTGTATDSEATSDDSNSTQSTTDSTSGPSTDTTGEPTTAGPTSTTNSSDSDSDSDSDTSTGTTGGDGDMDEDVEYIDCEGDPLTPPAEGTCEVVDAGTSNQVLLRGTVLAPTTVYRGGGVLLNGYVIECVGCDCAADAPEAAVVDCADGVISPGLINSHEHLGYVNNAPHDPGAERYEHRHEWRKGQNGHPKISYNGFSSTEEILGSELRFVMSGATSIIGDEGRFGLLRNLDSPGDLEGMPLQVVDSDTFPLDDIDGIQLDQGCDYGPDPETNAGISSLKSYVTHIGEGINTAARNEFLCTSSEADGANDVVEPQTSIIHGIALLADDAAEIRDNMSKIVWSPRSNIALYGNTAPIPLLDAEGVVIALGTDWVVSGSMNLLRELRCADEFNRDYLNEYLSAYDLWRMVTTNAALVAGAEQLGGMLKPGYVADIAVFRNTAGPDFRAVVGAEVDDVVLVMRGGQALYGDDALVADAVFGGDACEPLDVCGVGKRACVEQDTVSTLGEVRGAIEQHYPLFFCGGPDDLPTTEPSCVPYRGDDYPDGIVDGDADGDGIADGDDNCPLVFNPIRWLEDAQADADMDGLGDVCDPCPRLAGDACDAPSSSDIDGDGVVDGDDNCPVDENADQADADGDGKGDLCDSCPDPNPGVQPCPLTIKAIRDPNDPMHPDTGSLVAFEGAYVTAVRPDEGGGRGFYVQDESLDPLTGIFVFTASQSPGVEVGNRVTVTGIYSEYFELSEITNPVVEIEDAGVDLPFAPILVDPADVATGGSMDEGYESMLITVENVSIIDVNPDQPDDYDEFTVTGGLRIDDTCAFDLDNMCMLGDGFDAITGVLGYSFGDTKLLPRGPADVEWVDCDPFAP